MPESPLIAARYPTQDDGPYGGEQIQAAVLDLEPYTVPRFTDVAERDLAYSLWTQAGNALEDGMACHTKSDGVRWVRDGGAWLAFDTRWQSYTPVLVGIISVGTGGVNQGWYFRVGKAVHLKMSIVIGGVGANGGSGQWGAGLPPGMVAGNPGPVGAELPLTVKYWNAVGNCMGVGALNPGQDRVMFTGPPTTGNGLVNYAGSSPAQWSQGHNIHVHGVLYIP